MKREQMRAIHLFAGTGTMTRAFQRQGVEVVLAQEPDKVLAQVYRANFPGISLVEALVENVEVPKLPGYELLLAQVHIPPQVHISSYETTGMVRNPKQAVLARTSQMAGIMHIVRETKPMAFCFSVFGGGSYRQVCREQLLMPLAGEGYHVMFRELGAAEFGGVPFAGRNLYAIGCRTELFWEKFYLPAPIEPHPLGAWYLQADRKEELCRKIPEEIEKFAAEEKAEPGAIFRRRYAGLSVNTDVQEEIRVEEETGTAEKDWLVRNTETRGTAKAEKKKPYAPVACKYCPRLSRRGWYDTYVWTKQGLRRLDWKEYLKLQGDETIFPDDMSAARIWDCMREHGIYSVEYRVAEQLVRSLQEKLGTDASTGEEHIGKEQKERLVQALWNGDYLEGHRRLVQLKKAAGATGRLVEQELQFLYPAGCGQEDLKKLWRERKEELQVLCAVWCLSAQWAGSFGEELLDRACRAQAEAAKAGAETSKVQAETAKAQEEGAELQSVSGREFASSYEQGAVLEKAALELLRQMFRLEADGAEELEGQVRLALETLRRQKSGTQGGYDIRVVYLDPAGKKRVCLFECKNKHTAEITVADIAGKLEQAKSVEKEVEHWILVAPCGKLANDAVSYVERLERYPGGQLPIRDVQIWTEDKGVKEWFGLAPELCRAIYGDAPEDGDDPGRWPDLRRKQVLERWKQKLLPVALLPQALLDYPERTESLLFDVYNDSSLRRRYENLYKHYIRLPYYDEEGRYIERPLEDDLEKWLYQSGSSVKILLGEFGDGKTFFLYSFGRRLLEKFRGNPEENYLPICLSLKRMGRARTASEFIEERMRELGASRADFLELKKRYHVLVCLDGLDEMSVELDRLSLLGNVKRLINCCDELKGVKILLTSRRQCFMSYEIRDMLRERLGGFSVWQLAHATEEDVKQYLHCPQGRDTLQNESDEKQEEAPAVPENHKWLELAGKPLFLEMLQDLLEDGWPAGENENAVYEKYIYKCLQRKFEEGFDRGDRWVRRDETIERIYRALEKMAVKMQVKGQERLRLDEISSLLEEPAAEILWKERTADEKTREDAENRFSMRLLFKYEGAEEIAFAHRSIREYFVGKYLLDLLKEKPEGLLPFLEKYICSYEVYGFLAEGLKEEKALVDRLLSFLPECRDKRSAAAAKILQICFLADARIPAGEWSGQNLDGVYIPGADFTGQNLSHSWMRNANMNNVRLDDADCSFCDFTGSRLEETKAVEAVRQSGRKVRVVYADGLVRDWEPGREESQVCWDGPGRYVSALLWERGWLVQREQGLRELFLEDGQMEPELRCREEEQAGPELRYREKEQARILDISGSRLLLTMPSGEAGYLTAAVDCAKSEVQACWKSDSEAEGKLCGENAVVVSDGEKVCIFDGGRNQEYGFSLRIEGARELAAREEKGNYRMAILAEGSLILAGCRAGGPELRKKEHPLRLEGINHIATMPGNSIILGSSQGTVFLVPVNWETLEMKWACRQELQLGIYCRNIKTEGLVPQEVKRRLELHSGAPKE